MRKLLLFAAAFMLCMSVFGAETPTLPDGYVSIYSLTYTTVSPDHNQAIMAPATVVSGTSLQLLGPANGWGDAHLNYVDVSDYEKLAVKLTFAAEDAGKKCGIRYSYATSATTATNAPAVITVPEELNYTFELDLAGIAYGDDKTVKIGGIFFYAATNWAIADLTIDNLVTKSVKVEYVAVKKTAPTALTIVAASDDLAQALPIGQTVALSAQFTPSNTTNQAVTWISGNTSVATVSDAGVVTGVSAGDAIITATSVEDITISNTYTVTVSAAYVPVTGVEFASETAGLKIYHTKTLAYTVLPETASNKVVSWTSSDPAVASINSSTGLITAVAAGTTTITITTSDGNLTASCELTVAGYDAIPEDYVSIYSLEYTTVKDHQQTALAPAVVQAGTSLQLLGPGDGWGNAHENYVDVSDYEKLAVKLTFAAEDAGKQCAIRYSYATSSTAAANAPAVITVPEDLSYTFELDLADYVFDESKVQIGGIYFYATTHFSFTITDLVTKPVIIDYIAVKQKSGVPNGILNPAIENQDALVNVYNITGTLIRKNVKMSESTIGLSKGLYIVGNKKVFVAE